MKKQTRSYRNSYHIIAVEPFSENQARWAARDGRIDLVTCNEKSVEILFKESIFSLAKAQNKPIEFQMIPIILAQRSKRGKLIRQYSKIFSYVKQNSLIYCLSSGAKSPYHIRQMDTWRTMGKIFGTEYTKGKEAISKTALGIYQRNIERLKPEYIGEGMFIVEEEE